MDIPLLCSELTRCHRRVVLSLESWRARKLGKFYFQVKGDGQLIPDEEGMELKSLDDARQEALKGAREILCDIIRAGKGRAPEALVIADENGQPLEEVPLAAVLPEPFKR